MNFDIKLSLYLVRSKQKIFKHQLQIIDIKNYRIKNIKYKSNRYI